MKLDFLDALNAPTSTIAASGFTTLKATLKFADGTAVAQKRIDVTADLTKIAFPEGTSQLTDSSGIATIKVSRVANTTGGAGTANAAATISGTNIDGTTNTTVVTGSTDYSVGLGTPSDGAAKLTLANLDVGAATMAAYGTRQISVQANLGTVPSVTPVQVSFTSSCGQVSPTSATTNSNGVAAVSFTATDAVGSLSSSLGCGGKTVEISASAVGVDAVRKSINVTAAPATNLGFVVPTDASKLRIYLENSGGPTQAIIQFLLSNGRGEAIPGQDVQLTVKTVDGGNSKATFGTKGNVSPVLVTTDSSGLVSVPVYSGTVPTSVLINAALVSNAAIQTNSSILTVASGRPTQMRVSLSRGKAAIRGFNFDGEETTFTMSLADRQGNPVPDGTAVNFVTEGGVMIPPVCTTGAVAGDSRCTVKIRSQNPRPSNGLVTILAYAPGEEDFVDGNFNNVFDCGESFTDLGTAYRDDTATGGPNAAFVPGEFSVPRSASPSSCGTGSTPSPTVGDGVWGAVDVRGQAVIVFATDDVNIANPVWSSAIDAQWSNAVVTTQLAVSIQDLNGNSVPTGSAITVAASDTTLKLPTDGDAFTPKFGTCAITDQSYLTVPDSLSPLNLFVYLKSCVRGDQVTVTVKTTAVTKAVTFTVP